MEPVPISGLLLRRAVLGVLLAAGGPLTAAEVAEVLHRSGATTRPTLTKGPSRVIADLLAYQARLGRVAKVGPASFAIVASSLSRSTRQRCLRWRLQVAEATELVRVWREQHLLHASPLSDAAEDATGASERGDPIPTTASVSARRAAYPSTMPVPTSLTIGPAAADDVDLLVTFEGALFAEDAGRYDTFIDLSWAEREGRADFERLLANEDCLVLVARDGPQAIGHLVDYTSAASPTRLPVTSAILRSMYVVPGHRRQGAAELLVRAFIQWAREKGCVEAHVDSYALNEAAQRLYERHGFVVRSTARSLSLASPQACGGSA